MFLSNRFFIPICLVALGQAVFLVAGRGNANRRSKTLLAVGVVVSTENDAASADRKPWDDLIARIEFARGDDGGFEAARNDALPGEAHFAFTSCDSGTTSTFFVSV